MDPGKGMFEVVPSNSMSTGNCDIVIQVVGWVELPEQRRLCSIFFKI